MPIEPRALDDFTRWNTLIGFSYVEFTPRLPSGLYGAPVDFGILDSESLSREVSQVTLEHGYAGFLAIDREVVSRLRLSLELTTYNFRWDIARYLFGSDQAVAVVADAAAVVTNEHVNVPSGADAERQFVNLAHGDIDEASFTGTAVTCGTVTAEAVGTGQGGTFGETTGQFALDYKPLVIGDVTSFLEGGVERVADLVAGTTPAAGQIGIVVGTGATSGQITYPAGEAPAAGALLIATYTPSHAFANLTGYVVDPWLGKIRFLAVDGATDALRSGQPMFIDYTYNRKAGYTLRPFRQNQVDGRAVVRHLPDLGINFRWDVPSATLAINGTALDFGAEAFTTAALSLLFNDAGGDQRYGTLFLADENQSAL